MNYNETETIIAELNNFYHFANEKEASIIRYNAMFIKQNFDINYLAIALAIILDNEDFLDLIN